MKTYIKKLNGKIIPNDEAKKVLNDIKEGETVGFKIYKGRSLEQHNLYFAILNKCFDNLPEKFPFKSLDEMRHAMYLEVGYTETFKNFKGEVMIKPRSIAIQKCEGKEFNEHFQKIKDLVCAMLETTEQKLMEEL